MRRRHVILAMLAALPSRGDDASEIVEAVEPLASALTEGRLRDFAAALKENMPGRAQLLQYVRALVAFAEVTSSIVPIQVNRDRADLDWYMELRGRATGSLVERRRGKVSVRVTRKKVAELHPIDFFRLKHTDTQ